MGRSSYFFVRAAFATVALALTQAQPACKPVNWECDWPPTQYGPCCSSGGWPGIGDAWCSHLDSRIDCCEFNEFGLWVCEDDAAGPPPQGVCTGDAEIDAILNAAHTPLRTRMYVHGIYSWEGFCEAIRLIRTVPGLEMFLGGGDTNKGLTNIAGFLAHSMFETGGLNPYLSCDELDQGSFANPSCSQRIDVLYHELTEPSPFCFVDPSMAMYAETSTLSCVPGTPTEGCCWWGRGSIQLTGPSNYRHFQDDLVSIVRPDVDVCVNPEAVCQDEMLTWLSGMYYWTNVVQQDSCFTPTLDDYVDSGFVIRQVGACRSFPSGTGGLVNNGNWQYAPSGDPTRLMYFQTLMAHFLNVEIVVSETSTVSPSQPPSSSPTPSSVPTPFPTPSGSPCSNDDAGLREFAAGLSIALPANACLAATPYCNSQQYGSIVQSFCPLACGLCSPCGGDECYVEGECRFDDHANLAALAQLTNEPGRDLITEENGCNVARTAGYCVHAVYGPTVRNNCPCACN